MAVYQIYYASLPTYTNLGSFGITDTLVNNLEMFLEVLRNTPHTFIMILTRPQWNETWLPHNQKKLKEYQIFEMPYFVSNRNHVLDGRKLRLVILKGKGTDES